MYTLSNRPFVFVQCSHLIIALLDPYCVVPGIDKIEHTIDRRLEISQMPYALTSSLWTNKRSPFPEYFSGSIDTNWDGGETKND